MPTSPDRTAYPVVLVSMPFMAADRPSIQIGLLAAILREHGFPATTRHAALDFAARLGPARYDALAQHRERLIGEWLFSVEAFGAAAPDPQGRFLDDFSEDLAHLGAGGETREWLLRTRDRDVPAVLDALADEEAWAAARVVGFSSTFQQNAASIALARRLKARHPGLIIVFGGANLDAEMGAALMRTADVIDFGVAGEADTALPRLLDALRSGQDGADIPGVIRRTGGQVVAAPSAAQLEHLDASPPPDYDEYFARARQLRLLPGGGHWNVWLPFESARGCWWGAKHHCTFCGLNATSMRFRTKSVPRLLAELTGQARRYGSLRFEAVDNILGTTHLTHLMPRLQETRADYEIFYEVRAHLTRAQLRLLAGAGVRHLQPGIESLSSAVLRLMDKGTTAAQNVNLLRWARYYGLTVSWNILWGFPGETARQYADQARLIPHLTHLTPPAGASRIWMERFSPLFSQPERFPTVWRAPERSYAYVYPPGTDLDELAYFFEYELADTLPDEAYQPLREAVADWSAAWQRPEPPALTYWSSPGYLRIYDARHPRREGTYEFRGLLAEIYLGCAERPTSAAALRSRLSTPVPVPTVEEAIGEFCARGLMFRDGSLALSLALPAVGGR
ncbi:RiPP maturation radical SAM protein 1 [Plantactinospora sp. BC1]|uniref:RiPP maturation radical SAM C-methyltransferase n=1 Tax=Plantactinospora sp. BC1 TaxID=2108470 RepID=UPI000D164379|nr:RiPP maturation radical SAM C-methyltransferase [Plantactinospora sp. BC1]AVT33661.1 RiPP maturation radical SAM protein 1 [Plantactinospora sp. BC1]